jgi:hypothetical protein
MGIKKVTKINKNKGATSINALIFARRLARAKLTFNGVPSTVTRGAVVFAEAILSLESAAAYDSRTFIMNQTGKSLTLVSQPSLKSFS